MVLEFLKRSKKEEKQQQESNNSAPSQTPQPELGTQLSMPKDDLQHTTSLSLPRQDDIEEMQPVLNEADELFLRNAAAEVQPPPLPRRHVAISDDGEQIEEHDSGGEDAISGTDTPVEDDDATGSKTKRRFQYYWDFVPAIPSRDSLLAIPAVAEISQWRPSSKGRDRTTAANDLMSAATAVRDRGPHDTSQNANPEVVNPVDDEETAKERRDISKILGNLDMSAMNNRVISISKDSQVLLQRFNLVLKDIVNGVPTAYHDLENLLNDSHAQIDKMYKGMPPFVQTLVKSLPSKMMASYAPALLTLTGVSAAEEEVKSSSQKAKQRKKKRSYIPTLKNLIGEKGAVLAMLRSIINFLQLRFPALLAGTNVLMSLAVSILLFVFWYCHKRGKEVRLSKEEAELAEAGILPGSNPLTPVDVKDPSLQTLKTHTTLEDSNRHSVAVGGAAKALLPDGVPLPAAKPSEQGELTWTTQGALRAGEVVVLPPVRERQDLQAHGDE